MSDIFCLLGGEACVDEKSQDNDTEPCFGVFKIKMRQAVHMLAKCVRAEVSEWFALE